MQNGLSCHLILERDIRPNCFWSNC